MPMEAQPELKGIMREEAEGISLFLRLGQKNIKEYDKNNIIIKPQREIKGVIVNGEEAHFLFSPAGASKYIREMMILIT